jgi:hypothetical protein
MVKRKGLERQSFSPSHFFGSECYACKIKCECDIRAGDGEERFHFYRRWLGGARDSL